MGLVLEKDIKEKYGSITPGDRETHKECGRNLWGADHLQ